MLVWILVACGLTVVRVVLLRSLKQKSRRNPDATPDALKRVLDQEPWGTFIFFIVLVLFNILFGYLQHLSK